MKFRLRPMVITALLVALVGLVAGCGSSDSSSTGSGGAEGGGHEIAYFNLSFTNTYMQAVQEGIEETAKKDGDSVQAFDGEFNSGKQLNQIRDALATGRYDGFIISPVDGIGIATAIRQAEADEIPVVCTTTACGPDQGSLEAQLPGVAAHVGVSPVEEGVNTAEMISGACADTNPCEVAWIPGTKSIPTDIARNETLEKELEKDANVDLVAVEEGGFLAGPAREATQTILQAHPNVSVIATAGDQMTAGAEAAVKQAGKTDQVALVSNAGSKQGVEAVRDGRWYGTTAWPALLEGKLALETIVANLNGEETPNSIDVQKEIGFTTITKDNADEYTPEWSN
jgi:ribose transport system substrate-binding protein